MALIDKNDFKEYDRHPKVHSKVKATYTIFESYGDKYFQIDTYGTASRQIKGAVSQSIQIDKETAEAICSLLKKTFDL